MKNYSLILFSLLVLLAACSKDSSSNNTTTTTPTYYMKFKVNGTDYNGTSVNGNRGAAGDSTLEAASAFTYNGAIASMSWFIAGSYKGVGSYSTVSTEILMGTQTGDSYTSMPKSPVTAKVTLDDGNEVKGEFSGTIYNATDSTKTLSVTEGSFYIKIAK